MINEPQLLAKLDAAIASVGFPVRGQAIEQAWALTEESTTSEAFQERVRRGIGEVVPPGELLLLVTLRAKRGREDELVEAAEEFVGASRQLPGILGSTLYRSAVDPTTLTLAERFASRRVLEQHMATAYFQQFQRIQGPLLIGPVEAIFYERMSAE